MSPFNVSFPSPQFFVADSRSATPCCLSLLF